MSDRDAVYERTWKLYWRIMGCLGVAMASALMCSCLGPLYSVLPKSWDSWVLWPVVTIATLGFLGSVIMAIVFIVPWVKAHRELEKM